jgi:hypothetical protein
MAKFFINRPIVAMVISIIMVIAGAVTILALPTALFPDIAPPEIKVEATYTGADALTIEQSVATPIEQQMSGVDNLNYMYSINANNGMMTLITNFDLKTDVNTDQILAQMRQSQAASQLPAEVNATGVTVKKSTSAPLMLFCLYSPNGEFNSEFLANYAYININDQLTRVKGIASVTIFGAGEYAMRLWVRPDQLATMQITIPEIIDAIKQQNTVNPPARSAASRCPPGRSSHTPSAPRAAWSRRRISATSSSAPGPTARWSASRMSPGSSWAPRRTTSPAASTASPRPLSPFTNSPAPTPSTRPRAPGRSWKSSRPGSPPGWTMSSRWTPRWPSPRASTRSSTRLSRRSCW